MTPEERVLLDQVREYCRYYSAPIQHLVEVISDLKVIPMIRGKGFEYFAADYLRQNLQPQDQWEVTNPMVNPQLQVHDTDVTVRRTSGGRTANIECKLSAKATLLKRNSTLFKVKCMRSRTVGDSAAADSMMERYHITRPHLLAHKDNYREMDFDFVVASLENSLWDTVDNRYAFVGVRRHFDVLHRLFPDRFPQWVNQETFRQQTTDFLIIARSEDLIVSPRNNLTCVRRACIRAGTDTNCEFIPNYPVVDLNTLANNNGPWRLLPEGLDLIRNFTPPARGGTLDSDSS